MKAEGTDHFRAQRWDEAIVAYQSALGYLPKRKVQEEKPADVQLPEDAALDSEEEKLSTPQAEESVSDDSPPPLDANGKLRAVLNANLGACYVKLVS